MNEWVSQHLSRGCVTHEEEGREDEEGEEEKKKEMGVCVYKCVCVYVSVKIERHIKCISLSVPHSNQSKAIVGEVH